jgi:hypothetical protein
MNTTTRTARVEVQSSLQPVRPPLRAVEGRPASAPAAQPATHNWLLVALTICSCIFGAAMVRYVVNPTVATLASPSVESWDPQSP